MRIMADYNSFLANLINQKNQERQSWNSVDRALPIMEAQLATAPTWYDALGRGAAMFFTGRQGLKDGTAFYKKMAEEREKQKLLKEAAERGRKNQIADDKMIQQQFDFWDKQSIPQSEQVAISPLAGKVDRQTYNNYNGGDFTNPNYKFNLSQVPLQDESLGAYNRRMKLGDWRDDFKNKLFGDMTNNAKQEMEQTLYPFNATDVNSYANAKWNSGNAELNNSSALENHLRNQGELYQTPTGNWADKFFNSTGKKNAPFFEVAPISNLVGTYSSSYPKLNYKLSPKKTFDDYYPNILPGESFKNYARRIGDNAWEDTSVNSMVDYWRTRR